MAVKFKYSGGTVRGFAAHAGRQLERNDEDLAKRTTCGCFFGQRKSAESRRGAACVRRQFLAYDERKVNEHKEALAEAFGKLRKQLTAFEKREEILVRLPCF